jgi:hypothetical protein
MKVLITRASVDGTFDLVGTNNRWLFSDIQTEAGAINRAILYSQGRAYRIEFYPDSGIYGEPFRVIEQTAFPHFQLQSNLNEQEKQYV